MGAIPSCPAEVWVRNFRAALRSSSTVIFGSWPWVRCAGCGRGACWRVGVVRAAPQLVAQALSFGLDQVGWQGGPSDLVSPSGVVVDPVVADRSPLPPFGDLGPPMRQGGSLVSHGFLGPGVPLPAADSLVVLAGSVAPFLYLLQW